MFDREAAVRVGCEERAVFKAQHRQRGWFSGEQGMCVCVSVSVDWSVNQWGLLTLNCTKTTIHPRIWSPPKLFPNLLSIKNNDL